MPIADLTAAVTDPGSTSINVVISAGSVRLANQPPGSPIAFAAGQESEIQTDHIEMQKISLGLEFSDAVSQLLEELGPSKEFWEKRAELETVFESKIKDANIELQEGLDNRSESRPSTIESKHIPTSHENCLIQDDGFDTSEIEICGSELAKSLMDFVFDSGPVQEPTVLNCGRQDKQCDPGSSEGPNFCTCRSGNSSECGESSSYRGGQTTSVCSAAPSFTGGGLTGGVSGGCDLPCCSWIASGLTDKCVGIDCTFCRAGSGENRSVCESNRSTDVFQGLECGYTDPNRQTLCGQFSNPYTTAIQWNHVTSGAAGLLRARDRTR